MDLAFLQLWISDVHIVYLIYQNPIFTYPKERLFWFFTKKHDKSYDFDHLFNVFFQRSTVKKSYKAHKQQHYLSFLYPENL